ncbi:MAG: putative DNA binding domain-containing protein [Deltaproteobacteria bacterium]|nr:putative DNA binding domain-containing protein [Deltaproteobacteria bacterium]
MTQDELIELLNAHEWRDVEFKEAQREVPRSAYETVSAFANTEGGHLVFGVRKNGQDFEMVGVLDVDKVQNDFLTTLRQPDKLSVIVNVREELYKQGESDLLVFYVPEAHRSEKPVFLNRDIRRSYVRSGGCDVRCSDNERNRFLMDAAAERYDGQPVDLDLNTAFDPESINWYRAVYEGRPGNRSHATLSDTDFLKEMGLLVEQHGQISPSRAAIFLFGSNATLRQLLPRPVVDCQRFSLPRDRADAGERWIDRLVLDENLIRSWQSLIDWYQRFAERPFRVDPASLQRDDAPPDYRAFRESMVNLLIHQDYSDHSRKAEIRHYTDQTVFWNPGDAFATDTDLLEPGEKEVRNPRIVTAFRRIGLSENAGWGLRDVFRNWQQLGHVPPTITNNKGRKCFELVLKKEELLSEHQVLFQASLGVQLTDEQARVFAFACREKAITLPQIKAVTGLAGPDAVELADTLVTKVLFRTVEDGRKYALAEHLEERFRRTDQATDQPDAQAGDLITAQVQPEKPDLSTAQVEDQAGDLSTGQVHTLTELSETHWKIIELCDVPRRLVEILEALGVTNRGYFKEHHLDPLIQSGIVAMTNPKNPRASNQKYVITEAGAQLKARRMSEETDRSEDENGEV